MAQPIEAKPVIEPSNYETWETLILTEQVPVKRIIELLEENPEFALWLKARRNSRY